MGANIVKDTEKPKQQLINELTELRQRIAELEKSEKERRWADEALQVSETSYRRLFETAQDGILLLDADTGKITDVNPFLIDMLGYSHEELLGKKLWDIGLFKDIVANKAAFLDLQTKGYVRYEDLPFETKDGRSIDVEFINNVYLVNTNKTIQCNIRNITERRRIEDELSKYREHIEEQIEERTAKLKMTNEQLQRNITKRKGAEETLQKSEQHYRSLFENMLEGFAFCRMLFENDKPQDFIYLDVNTAFKKLTGLNDVVGKKVTEVIPGIRESHPELFEIYGRVAMTGKPERFEIYLDVIGWLDISVYSLEKGSFVAVFDNITERKKAEKTKLENERLAAADKAKSEFLANMSHELRTPLNSILGFSEILKGGLAGKLDEKQEHFIDNIFTSGTFLLSLINDILDLSKIEAGKIELVREKMSVPVTIKETLTLIKEKAMKHNVLLKTEFDPELEFIEADKQRFKQILFNLLSNAVKFSKEEGGTVTITARKESDMAKISVSDTGIGIKEENIGRLFHKFEQLEYGISQKYGGTGLGLAITKQLVEMHGGNIRAESRYGEGSNFMFMLPLNAKGTK